MLRINLGPEKSTPILKHHLVGDFFLAWKPFCYLIFLPWKSSKMMNFALII